MDPRLKAYQKQVRPGAAAPVSAPEPNTPDGLTPRLPQFDEPPKPSASLVKTTASTDKSLRKVAKFLILLGQAEAAKVVRHLDPDQIEAVGQEIASIKKIEPIEAEAILKEFGYIAKTKPSSIRGGKEAAKAILDQAFGGTRAKKILHKAVPQAVEKPFAFFSSLTPEVVLALLGAESPPVLAIVVPFLEKAQAAAFLKALDPPLRMDLVKRLAKMEKVPSTVVAQVEHGLRERFHSLAPTNTEAVDGKARLADILRHMTAEREDSILKALGRARPELTDDLRRRLFTQDDLIRVMDEDFEDLLRAKDDAQLALLWLAGEETLKAKIRANVSARRLLLVQGEVDLLSDTPKRELQRELRFFLDEVREAVRDGRAALLDESEEYV